MRKSVSNSPQYHNESFALCQREFEKAVERGLEREKLEAFLIAFYTEQCRTINPSQIQDVRAIRLESHVLKPRQDLYRFVVYNWLISILIPSFDETIREKLLVFGIGRIFSAYSTIGVQYCTDADLNFVLCDSIKKEMIEGLQFQVSAFAVRMWEVFGIIIEVDSSFTVLTVSQIAQRLCEKDSKKRKAATLFYKGNSESLFIVHCAQNMYETVFAPVSQLSDDLLFDNFIGENPVKPTFYRLKNESARLTIIADDTQEKEEARWVIGTKTFDHQCRILSSLHAELYPPDWCFSMKYTVNRIFDYVSAMHHAGYSFKEIGFTGSSDPDYKFLNQCHRLMLFLQEIIHVKLDTFNYLSDYSYINSKRFEDFIMMPKGNFKTDFDSFVLGPHFLLASERKHYLMLKQAIHEKQRVKLLLTTKQELLLEQTFGYDFRHKDNGSGKVPVSVPYTWSGLGFFVFSAVHLRLDSIVENKLFPSRKKK